MTDYSRHSTRPSTLGRHPNPECGTPPSLHSDNKIRRAAQLEVEVGSHCRAIYTYHAYRSTILVPDTALYHIEHNYSHSHSRKCLLCVQHFDSFEIRLGH